MAVSSATRAAPQEVFRAATGGLLAAKSEMTQAERQARRQARREQKKKHFTEATQQLMNAAAAGDGKAKAVLEEKQQKKAYEKAVKSGKVVIGKPAAGGQDTTKYGSSAQVFRRAQDAVLMDQAQREGKDSGRRKSAVGADGKRKLTASQVMQ